MRKKTLTCWLLLLLLAPDSGAQPMEPFNGDSMRALGQAAGALYLEDLPSSLNPFALSTLDDQEPSQQAPVDRTPEPYSKDEFPKWARDLWRFTVIFVGSIPFTYFFTMEGYDFYKYASSGFSTNSAPWPFRGAEQFAYSSNEEFWIIFTALTASFLVASADFIIGRLSEPHEDR
jgi:hypothetical protein